MTRQQTFIKALAQYLVGDQVRMSILLETNSREARSWQSLRAVSPLFGYPTVEEAEYELTQFLKGL